MNKIKTNNHKIFSRSESRRSWSSGLLPLDLFTLYYETLPVKIICKPNQTKLVQKFLIDPLPVRNKETNRKKHKLNKHKFN